MEVKDLKKISEKSYTIALAKQNALEKAQSRMILAHNGHLFTANTDTINLVETLSKRHDQFVILDSNNNPCLISDPLLFLDRLIEKNQEVLNIYYQTYKEFQKLR